MKIYIDIEHLKSLVNYIHEKEVMKLIKENFDIYYTFDESDIKREKRQKIRNIESWQKELATGRNGKSVCYNSSIPIHESFRLNHDMEFVSNDALQSVFFIKDKELVPNGLIYCELGDELKMLRNLLIESKCIPAKFYYTRPEGNSDIEKWNIVTNNVSPCTDIIINDPYIFAQNEVEYKANSFHLIEKLVEKSVDTCVNIVIVTKKDYFEGNTTHVIYPKMIKDQLKESVEHITHILPNITIIAQDYKTSKLRIHDRTIFTNYKLFISGDSFHYYEEKTNNVEDTIPMINFTSNGIWFGVCSLFDDEHNRIAMRFLHDIQSIVDESKMKANIIFGDGVSNYLDMRKKCLSL